jgi:hypothetical protein
MSRGRWLVTYTIKTAPSDSLGAPSRYADHTHVFDSEGAANEFAEGLCNDSAPGVRLNFLQTIWFWAVAEIAFGSDD